MRRTATVVVMIGLLCGCGAGEGQPSRSPTSSIRATGDQAATLEGVGPFRVGMSKGELVDGDLVAPSEFEQWEEAHYLCGGVAAAPDGYADVTLMVDFRTNTVQVVYVDLFGGRENELNIASGDELDDILKELEDRKPYVEPQPFNQANRLVVVGRDPLPMDWVERESRVMTTYFDGDGASMLAIGVGGWTRMPAEAQTENCRPF